MENVSLQYPVNITEPLCMSALSIFHIVIPHLEIRACDWSKLLHVAVNKSRKCPHETLFALINYAC